MIPLTYFAENDDLEVVVENGFALVRVKGGQSLLPSHERQPEMLQEVAAFAAQHGMLVADYLDKYVAIYKGEVVDHDADHLQLVRRIDASYPDEIVLIRQVTAQLPEPLRGPTPRLVSQP